MMMMMNDHDDDEMNIYDFNYIVQIFNTKLHKLYREKKTTQKRITHKCNCSFRFMCHLIKHNTKQDMPDVW